MATRHTDRLSLTAGADLSSSQNILVKLSADNTVVACGAGGDAVGVNLNKPVQGQPSEVGIGPRIPCVIGTGPLTAGAEVMSDANGKVVAWVTANRSLGYLLVGGNTGDTVELLFDFNGRKA